MTLKNESQGKTKASHTPIRSMRMHHLPRSQPPPLIPLKPPPPQRGLLLKGILRPPPHLLLLLLRLLLRLEPARGVRVAEAVHVDGLDANAGTAVAAVARADAVASVFFAVAPFVEGVVLAAHGGCKV